MSIDDELARIRSTAEAGTVRKTELLAKSRRTILNYQMAFADFFAALVQHDVPLASVVELTFHPRSETYSAAVVGYCWPYAGMLIMSDGTFNRRPPGPWGRGDVTPGNEARRPWLGKGARRLPDTQDVRKDAAAKALRKAGITGEVLFIKPDYVLEEVDWLEDLQPELRYYDNMPSEDLAVVGLGLHLALRERGHEQGPEPCLVDTSEGRHYLTTLSAEFAKYISSRTG